MRQAVAFDTLATASGQVFSPPTKVAMSARLDGD
jgi:hypothetical protein